MRSIFHLMCEELVRIMIGMIVCVMIESSVNVVSGILFLWQFSVTTAVGVFLVLHCQMSSWRGHSCYTVSLFLAILSKAVTALKLYFT